MGLAVAVPPAIAEGAMWAVIPRRTGLLSLGSITGGEIREASGTRSVSEALPSPTGSPSRATPGQYRGATTSGKR